METEEKQSPRKWPKRIGIGCLGVVVLGVLALNFTGPGRDVMNLWKNGTIPALIVKPPKRTYSATNEKNLMAIHTALMLYHDSEEKFPEAAGWMDAIKNRIRADDMDAKEAAKKLVRPDLVNQSDAYGYAINEAAAGKYKDDVGASTVLVYESKQTGRNAHGKPETDRDGYAVTVEGKLLPPEGEPAPAGH